jgi:hypothetical protein
MKKSGTLHFAWKWLRWFCGPFRFVEIVRGLPRYVSDWISYGQMPGAEKLRLADSYPCFGDRRKTHEVDPQYFYVNSWAARRIISQAPVLHVDVASQIVMAGMLSAAVPVVYLDYRPLEVTLSNLSNMQGDILNLPFRDNSVTSLSCLHVAEHIGLGRYGDPIDPNGTIKACRELSRVLAAGGCLYFAVPIGRPRVCFNAHRIFDPSAISNLFPGLKLEEFSAVSDDGCLVEKCDAGAFKESCCALGMYWLRKSS